MDGVLLYGIKGCIGIGSLAIAVGLASNLASNACTTQYQEQELGLLSNVLGPTLHKLKLLTEFYPSTEPAFKRITSLTAKFARKYHKLYTPKDTRDLLLLQRRLFDELDGLLLDLSESTALEDVHNIGDDIKQVVTDVCLGVDQE